MRLILTRAWRNVVRMRVRFIAVGLISASGLAMYVGVYSAVDSLFQTQSWEYDRGRMADLELRIAPEDIANLPQLNDIPGLQEVARRLVFQGHITLKDGTKIAAVLIGIDVPSGTHINQLTLLEGEALGADQPDQVLIERNLANYHGYGIGDALVVKVGGETYQLKVRGVALSPEYLIAPANPSFFVPTKGSVAVVFAPLTLIHERLGFPLINSLLFRYEQDADPDALRAALLERAATRLTVDEHIPLHNQFGYLFLKVDLDAFKIFLPAVVVIFTVTAFLIIFFLIFQWLVSERQELGTLMALGHSKRALAIGYGFAGLLLTSLAIVAGSALSLVTLYGFGANYANAIGFPEPHLRIHATYAGLGALGIVLTVAAAMGGPQTWLFSLTPLRALRASFRNAETRLGRFADLLAGLGGKLWFRYAVRNIFRNKTVSLMTVCAVGLSLGVSIAYFVSLTSFEETALRSFERDKWTATADFFAPVWNEDLVQFDRVTGVYRWEPYVKGNARLITHESRGITFLTGVQPGSQMRQLTLLAGRGLQSDDYDVIVCEKKLVEEHGLLLGDRVILEAGGRQEQVHLVGVFSGDLPGAAYVPFAMAQDLFDLTERATGLFLQADVPESQLRESLYGIDDVGNVTFKAAVVEDILDATKEVGVIINVAAVFSIAVAALFIFSSVAFTILQRRAEYGMFRILGFDDRTITEVIIAEIMVLGAIASLLAVIVAFGVSQYFNTRLSEAWFAVDMYARAPDFMLILIPALIFLPLACLPAVYSVLHFPIERTLREKRFG